MVESARAVAIEDNIHENTTLCKTKAKQREPTKSRLVITADEERGNNKHEKKHYSLLLLSKLCNLFRLFFFYLVFRILSTFFVWLGRKQSIPSVSNLS